MSDTFDAGSIESRLVLDRSDFVDGLREAQVEGENFAKKEFKAKLGVDKAAATLEVDEFKAQLASLRDVNLNIGISGTNAQIRAISQSASALDGRNIGLSVGITGIADANAQLRTLRQLANSLDGRHIGMNTDIDTASTLAGIAAVRAGLNDLDGSTARTSTSTNRMGSSMLGGRNKMMMLAEAALYLAPALVPLSGALIGVTATALSMGITVGAALGIFGAATFGAVGNVNGLNKTLDKAKKALDVQKAALDQLVPGTNAYAKQLQKVDDAQNAVNEANAAFSPTQKKFSNALTAMKGSWKSFIQATEADTLGVASTAVETLTLALPKLVPVVHAITPEMQALAQSFHDWVTDGGLNRFLKIVINTGVPAFHNLRLAVKNVFQALGEGFRAFVPRIQEMSNSIAHVSQLFMVWAAGGGFQNFIGYLNANSPAVQNFMTALWNALKALSQAFQDLGNPSLRFATILLQIVAAMPPWLLDTLIAGFFTLRVAMLAYAIATGIAAVATTVLATVSSPFFILLIGASLTVLAVVAAIVALGVGIYFLVKNWGAVSSFFVRIWNVTWNWIKNTALEVWDLLGSKWGWFIALFGPIGWTIAIIAHWGQVVNAFKTGMKAIEDSALWFWNVVLKPTFNAISIGARLLMVILGTVLFTPLYLAFKLVSLPAVALWLFVFKPVFGWIQQGAGIFSKQMQGVFNTVVGGLHILGAGATWLWNNGFKPAFGAIETGAKAWWTGTQIVFNTVIGALKVVGKWASWLWSNVFKPTYGSITTGSKVLYTSGIKPPMDLVVSAFKTVGRWAGWLWNNGIKPQWNAITTGTGKLKDAMIDVFGAMKTGIGKIWDGVRGIAAKPINFVIDTVYNGGIVKVWNKIAHAVGLDKMKLDNVSHVKYATGGAIEGGMAGLDSKQILAMPGEHVWTAEEVKNFGGHKAMASARAAFASTGKARVAPGRNSSHYDLGGAISGGIGVATGLAGATVGKLEDLVRGAVGMIANPILNTMETAASKGVNALVPASVPYGGLMGSLVKQPFEWIKDLIAKDDKSNAGKWGGGTVPSGIRKALIDTAMKAAGVPPPGTTGQWETGMNTLVTRESNWNPSAVNLTDSNAKAGHPSQGLTQTIPGTFNAYVPDSVRSRGILDPLANIAASIRYIVSKYGNITNVQQANAALPPKGYAGGGVTVPGIHMFGEKGPELVATSGGDRVFTASETNAMLTGASGGAAPATPIKFPDHFTVKIGEREFLAMLDDETRATMADVFDEAARSR